VLETPSVRERLLEGPQSVRVSGEWRALIVSLLAAPIAVALVGTFFHGITVSEVALLVVVGLVLVSLARGRLLGSSIRVTERQFPAVFDEVQDIARRLGVEPPLVFLRDDPFVPITSIGTEEPYALVISSQYFEHLSPSELRFLIAREVGHIAAGHTRIQSMFSASGRENPFISAIFGSWLRKTEYTADRIGLLFCDRFEDAVNAIAITTFHAIGRRVDHDVLDEQRRELEEDARLRLGEFSSASPFATNRIGALGRFADHPLAKEWSAEFAGPLPALPPAQPRADAGGKVTRADCASPIRRFAAVAIDVIVIQAIMQSGLVVSTGSHAVDFSHDKDLNWLVTTFPFLRHLNWRIDVADPREALAFFSYCALLVALAGQTLGMMIAEVHVVTTRFGRVTPARAVWRYVAAFLSTLLVVPAALGLFMRRPPHDRLSATRVVRNQRLRSAASVKPP
jgi:Zn-dependent protease with chaperone function